MPVKNNGPGMTGRSSMTKKSKIEPEYPQWAESKMRAIENRRLKSLLSLRKNKKPAPTASDMMDTATWFAASRTGSALCVTGSVGG